MAKRVRRTRRHQRHREAVMRAHNGICHICGQPAADAIDHIVPVALGGSDDPMNLAPAHTSCNTAKGDSAPPSWAYSRPQMWLPGYGPNSPGSTSNGSGCWSYGAGAAIGFVVGSIISVMLGLSALAGGVAVGIAVFLGIFFLRQRQSITQAQRVVPSVGEPTVVSIAGEDSPPRNARGISMNGGRERDGVAEGDTLVEMEFTPVGDNIETLVELLWLAPGQVGYRDGLVRVTGNDLEVIAMIRLAADVEASGDEDVGAAPIGLVPESVWSAYPRFGEGFTLVQVCVSVNAAGGRGGWVLFSERALNSD